MRRRIFLKRTISASLALPASSYFVKGQSSATPILVLNGGRIFYRNKWESFPLGIKPSGDLVILKEIPVDTEVRDVTGQIISPGFIDILADNAANPQKTFRLFEKFKVTDGVTTALQMHGGSEKVKWYYEYFGALPHYINFGVSVFVMRIRYAWPDLKDRLRLVEQNLEAGALGVSHSIEYQPTPYDEVLSYARLAKKYDRPFFLHLRYSSEGKELAGVDEAIRIARESGARVHIDHLHSTGGTYHMEDALNKIRAANTSGLRLTCCVYPYSYWATYLNSKRFDEGWRERYGLDYSDLRLVGTGERLTAESFARYRKLMKLAAVPEGTLPLNKTVDLALKEPFCMIGSDGGIESEPRANSHPRGAGCFSTAIRHGLNIGMSLEDILSKMTTLPANLIMPAMAGRGAIENGNRADLVVFDSKKINGKAGVENPNQFSEGINMVFVNGKLAYEKGSLMQSAGVAIKYDTRG
jgi:N-acyl-D-aspartate/D-glutamate deacylase